MNILKKTPVLYIFFLIITPFYVDSGPAFSRVATAASTAYTTFAADMADPYAILGGSQPVMQVATDKNWQERVVEALEGGSYSSFMAVFKEKQEIKRGLSADEHTFITTVLPVLLSHHTFSSDQDHGIKIAFDALVCAEPVASDEATDPFADMPALENDETSTMDVVD